MPTESMSAGLQWFAQYQPFTPFIETLRAFLLGTPMGINGWLSIDLVRSHRLRRLVLGTIPL